MAIQDGDILSALQAVKSDTSKISQTLSDMSGKDIHQIQQDISTLVRISQGTRRTEESARFQRERDERARDRQARRDEYSYRDGYQYRSQGTSRQTTSTRSSFSSKSRSSYKSSFDGVVDEFLASFSKGVSEQLKKSLTDSPIHKQIKGHIKKFADDLGIEVSQIPSELGKELGKAVMQNTQFGRRVSSAVQGIQDKILSGVINNVKQRAASSSQGGPSFQDIYNQFVENYRRTHDAPQGARGQQAPNDQEFEGVSRAVRSSDSYMPVLQQINEYVFAILQHLDSSAAEKLGRQAQDATRQRSDNAPEVSNTQQLGLESDFDSDLFNNLRNRAQGIYNKLLNNLKSKIASSFGGKFSNLFGSNFSSIFGGLGSVGGSSAASTSTAIVPASSGAGTALAGSGGGGLATVGSGLVAKAGMLGPEALLIALAAYVAMKKFSEAIGPATEGIKQFGAAAKKVQNRFWESQKEMLKEEQKRIEADIKTMAETPFKIMSDAAQKWYDAWDNQLKTIGQTQGYTKSDVQTLFSSYAERLRSEGLSDVIGAADISSSLGSVLKAGLSGKIAEEFAYQATVLGNAIPSQDFFGYADTYAQVIGNAMARGLNESEAIQEANRQLQQFASNLLYAGRNISNGIATGLKDGSQLFADAVKIANTARIGDSTQISGVLTSVAAEISAIAPDLASDIVSNVVQAAIGGNNSDLVALRSMAGIGASNTAFIKALAENPQKVFASLFTNLATMQQLNADNYMEVAESLSETFGISASAFARIDFRALAQAVASMQINQTALSENLDLLKSGETTPSPEALRMRQINQMILDEGLAYVLDNEAARQIQQHMWDQELANEIMEREYSVDFAGSAKEMVQGIVETIHNILKILNPFSWIGGLANLAATSAEYGAQKSDLRTMLEQGKVGSGSATAFRNLTNYNGSSLDSVPSLMDMLELTSQYQGIHTALSLFNAFTERSGYGVAQFGSQMLGSLGAQLQTSLSSYSQNNINSKYSWGFVGKSLANAIANTPVSSGVSGTAVLSSSDSVRKKQADTMNKLLASMDEAIEANKSFDEWKASATAQYKISDFKEALSAVGLTEADVEGQFGAKESQKVSKHIYDRQKVEDEFWEKAIKYYDIGFPEFANAQLSKMDIQIDLQTEIREELINFRIDSNAWWNIWVNTAWKKDWVDTTWKKDWVSTNWANKFLAHWVDRYVKFDTYSRSTNDAYKAIDKVKNENKKKESGDAVLALAKALTDNTADLKDPTIQSNALLAQILIVVEAILQAENISGGASLQTSLSALGLGLTTSDTSIT